MDPVRAFDSDIIVVRIWPDDLTGFVDSGPVVLGPCFLDRTAVVVPDREHLCIFRSALVSAQRGSSFRLCGDFQLCDCTIGEGFPDDEIGILVDLEIGQLGVLEIGAPEIGAPEISAPEIGAPEIGAPEIGAPEIGALETGVPETGALEIGSPEIGSPEIGSPEIGSPEIGSPEIGVPEIGVLEIGAPEIGAPEIGALEIGALEIGALEIGIRFDFVSVDDHRLVGLCFQYGSLGGTSHGFLDKKYYGRNPARILWSHVRAVRLAVAPQPVTSS